MGDKPTNLADRIWDKVRKLPGKDACWIWTGSINGQYGQILNDITDRKSGNGPNLLLAQRAVWLVQNGYLPESLHQTCDTPLCVRHWAEGSKRDLAERFWEKVEKLPGDGCWLWRGHRAKGGYGRFGMGRDDRPQVRLAAQVAWELVNGRPFPKGKVSCHECDNPPCLFLER